MKSFLMYCLASLIGALIITQLRAHPPCEEGYQPPQCGYVQVVNPLSGELEQQYICE